MDAGGQLSDEGQPDLPRLRRGGANEIHTVDVLHDNQTPLWFLRVRSDRVHLRLRYMYVKCVP